MYGNNSEKNTNSHGAFWLGGFVFSVRTNELQDRNGNVVHLRKKSAEMLSHLLHHHGTLVSKADLLDAIWPGTNVTEDSLVQCITDIRRALNDRDHKLIRTFPKKGYKAHAVPLVATSDAAALPLPARPSIAVLAFDDFSAGTDTNFLSDAIAEGVIAELSRFPELFVVARNSSFSFRDRSRDVTQISQALGVRYVLEGSQQKDGHRLRVTAQLIDAVDRHHLCSVTFDRDLDDLFQVQDEIVRKVVATVAQKVVNLEGGKAIRSRTPKLTALIHHLKARLYLVRFTPDENEMALAANLAAIDADPTQPYGYAGLAFVHINGHRWGWTDLARHDALNEARKAAQKALDLAPDYYDGHAAMAYVHLEDGDLDRAIARAERVLELNPNDTNGMCDLAEFLGYAGRTGEAEQLLLKAMRLDPLHPDWFRWNLAWIQWLDRNCVGALQTMNLMSQMPPMAYRVLAIVHICLGQTHQAREAVDRLLEFDPNYSLEKVRENYRGKFKNRSDYERVVNNLSDAGLPE